MLADGYLYLMMFLWLWKKCFINVISWIRANIVYSKCAFLLWEGGVNGDEVESGFWINVNIASSKYAICCA